MITAYLCAPVRGKDGDKVKPEVKWDNVKRAIVLGRKIRERFPELELFIPHEHEVIIDTLQQHGLNSDDIIEACCDIVSMKDLIIVYCGDGISAGMNREIDAACLESTVYIDSWNEEAELEIAKGITEVAK